MTRATRAVCEDCGRRSNASAYGLAFCFPCYRERGFHEPVLLGGGRPAMRGGPLLLVDVLGTEDAVVERLIEEFDAIEITTRGEADHERSLDTNGIRGRRSRGGSPKPTRCAHGRRARCPVVARRAPCGYACRTNHKSAGATLPTPPGPDHQEEPLMTTRNASAVKALLIFEATMVIAAFVLRAVA